MGITQMVGTLQYLEIRTRNFHIFTLRGEILATKLLDRKKQLICTKLIIDHLSRRSLGVLYKRKVTCTHISLICVHITRMFGLILNSFSLGLHNYIAGIKFISP
jgi:hypothetical protein